MAHLRHTHPALAGCQVVGRRPRHHHPHPPTHPPSLPAIPSSPRSTKSCESFTASKGDDGEAFDDSLSSHTSVLLLECLHVPPLFRSPSLPPHHHHPPHFFSVLPRIRISEGASQSRGEAPQDSLECFSSASAVSQRSRAEACCQRVGGSGAAQLVCVRSCQRNVRVRVSE